MKYEELPKAMQEGAIKPYWDLLQKKKGSLILKRLMDIVASFLMLVILSPFLLILAAAVKLTPRGQSFTVRSVWGATIKISKFLSSAPWSKMRIRSALLSRQGKIRELPV